MDKYAAVLFDMDGLMFDTEKLAKQSLCEASSELGLVPDMEVFIGITGCSRDEARSRMIDYCGSEAVCRELLKMEEDKLAEFVSDHGTPLKPGLMELLHRLEERKIRRAVVSCSHRKRVDACIENSGVKPFIDLIITGEEVKRGKPAPDAYLIAAEILQVSPEKCLVLEDSVSGGKAGIAAGMEVALIPDLIQPSEKEQGMFHYVMKTLFDILPLFE